MNNQEIRSSYVTVKNVSRKKISKRKLYKNGILALSGAAIILVSSLFISGQIEKRQINEIPDDQILTTISIQVNDGDTISDIANRFYTDDCEGVYRYVSNYEDAIEKQNRIYGSHIEYGDTLEIPVVIDKNNPYYLQILDIKDKIAEIEDNNLWVRHKVKLCESVSELAQLSSGSVSETYENVKKIYSKNNIDSKHSLLEGEVIWIMNPELGQLKMELSEAENQLKQALKVEQQKKNY